MKHTHLDIIDMRTSTEVINISVTAAKHIEVYFVTLAMPSGERKEIQVSREDYNKLKRRE